MLAHQGVDLKRRPPKSLPTAPHKGSLPGEDAARKDPAVHVSLSSDSLVKQPGFVAESFPGKGRRTVEAPFLPTTIGSFFTCISEELQRRAIAPRRAACRNRQDIGATAGDCQQPISLKTAAPWAIAHYRS